MGGTSEVTSVNKRELDGARVGQQLRAVTLGYGMHDFILNGRLILFLLLHYCTSIV
jgi:hypothetical protein